MQVRSQHLYGSLRSFCLGAFAVLGTEPDGEIPFALDERNGLYEYRLLLRDHVEARAHVLSRLEDAQIAIGELQREPAAAIFARGSAAERTLFGTILVPLLVSTAEACGGFDWDDGAFNRVYGDLEQSLFGSDRRYAAEVPLVGVSIGGTIDLARGIQVRTAASHGREPEAVLALECTVPAGETVLPDAPGELADAVTALRLATGAAGAAGPVILERLDGHPLADRPMLWIAATEPQGEETRLDPWRGRLAGDLLARLGESERDAELGEAIERWELSLFESEPLRSERLREALSAALGGADGLWAAVMRAVMLIGETGDARAALAGQLRGLARGERGAPETADAVRRVLVETVMGGDRRRLAATLDDALLGLRARPAGYFSARASAA